jgi:hypothetical protein
METWNQEAFYAKVWERPLTKVAPKYGISAVALGQVCHKLQIPRVHDREADTGSTKNSANPNC